jgi:Outer membrane protein beta-barrel domain
MKRLLILVIAIPLFTNAQKTQKSEAGKKIIIGFSLSPDYSNRTLINNDGNSSSDMVINSRNEIEKGKFSYTTGFNLDVRLSEKLEFQTGILYSNKGYKTPKRAASYQTPRPSEPTHIKSEVLFNYLDIPVKLNYISGKRKIKIITGVGIAASFLLKESDVYTLFYVDGSEKEIDNYNAYDHNNFNLFALISVGLEFKVKKNLSFRAEPSYRYGILKTIDDVPVSERLWNIGLNMGVYLNIE